MKLNHVAVSGANGFIGSSLVERLGQLLGPGRVFGLVRRKILSSRYNVYCDFSDPTHIARVLRRLRPSVLFHAAGGSHGTFDEVMEGNIFTTLHLFEALSAIKSPVRVVIFGSAAEYGDTKERCSAARTLLRPMSPYAWTKTCQTLLAGLATRSGVDVVVARLFNFSGPGVPLRFAVGSFARQIANAERSGVRQIEVGNLGACRDLIDIRDAVSAIIRIAQNGTSGAIYDVCSGSSVPMRRVLELLLQQARTPLRIRAAAEQLKKGEISFSLGDPSLVKSLGWEPSISLKKSLLDTLQYYRLADRRAPSDIASACSRRL
jgi:GDP-4-dehydro-6-deoxy-D-mannose reductase